MKLYEFTRLQIVCRNIRRHGVLVFIRDGEALLQLLSIVLINGRWNIYSSSALKAKSRLGSSTPVQHFLAILIDNVLIDKNRPILTLLYSAYHLSLLDSDLKTISLIHLNILFDLRGKTDGGMYRTAYVAIVTTRRCGSMIHDVLSSLSLRTIHVYKSTFRYWSMTIGTSG